MQVRPLGNYHLLGSDIRLDRMKTYPATIAYNQPDWFKHQKVFVCGMLLERGEYVIVSGEFRPKFTFVVD